MMIPSWLQSLRMSRRGVELASDGLSQCGRRGLVRTTISPLSGRRLAPHLRLRRHSEPRFPSMYQ